MPHLPATSVANSISTSTSTLAIPTLGSTWCRSAHCWRGRMVGRLRRSRKIGLVAATLRNRRPTSHVGRPDKTRLPPMRQPMLVRRKPSLRIRGKMPRCFYPTSHVGRSCGDPRAPYAAPMRWRGWPSGMFEPADAPVLASDYQPARVGHQTTEATSDIITRDHRHPERIPRARHRLRDRDRALARGAHRLRPCADGDDGVMGFRRHRSGGGTGGRRLEPIVGADRRQHFDPSQVYLRVRALGCSKTSFVAEGTSLKPSRMRG